MVLSNRTSKTNKKGKNSFIYSNKNVLNHQQLHGDDPQSYRNCQKRGLLCLALAVATFYEVGIKTSSFRSTTGNEIDAIIHTGQKTQTPFVETIYKENKEDLDQSTISSSKFSTENDAISTKYCKIPREYPEIKYYQLTSKVSELPSFLTTEAQYIRGLAPFILRPFSKKKLCIDSSAWDEPMENRLPFSDGQNPSIMSLSTRPNPLSGGFEDSRLSNIDTIEPILELVGGIQALQNMFAGVVYVGGAQCGYGMTTEEKEQYRFSQLEKPPAEQALFLLLDSNFGPMIQRTILLERDQATWGRITFRGTKLNDKTIEKLDDPRLFFYQGEMWILFRNGRAFGYEKQIHNKLHFELLSKDSSEEKDFVVYIKASETITTCCGRNMAMISEVFNTTQSRLKTVTWVDPITVDIVSDPNLSQSAQEQRTSRMLEKQERSNIHGTNGYMISLDASNEYLGIAHFHRPEDRKESPYALHGHHYTHAFFTISKSEPHILKRISNEFVFESLHPSSHVNDGEVIQFASGLDLITKFDLSSDEGNTLKNEIIISYGINDCEAAVVTLDLEQVQKLMIEVNEGDQVIDLMKRRNDM